MKQLLLIILLLTTLVGRAQMKVGHSLTMDFKLPITLENKSFKHIVDGVSDFNLSLQLSLWGITTGIGVKHTLFQINDFSIPETTHGKIQMVTAFGKLGYEQFVSNTVFYEFSVKSGFTFIDVNSLTCEAVTGSRHHSETATLIEPNLGFYMISKDNLAFGILVSYTLVTNEFKPETLCLTSFAGQKDENSNGMYGTLNIGFGFSVFLKKKKNSFH